MQQSRLRVRMAYFVFQNMHVLSLQLYLDETEALHTEQEVQLSQKDCALLHVTEYFAKSLKVTQDHSKRYP